MKQINTVAILVMIVAAGCGDKFDTGVTPENAYGFLAGHKIPVGVTNIQCAGAIWQECNVYLRFTAPAAEITYILSLGYTPATWAQVSANMNPGPYGSEFNPAWSVSATGSWKFYIRILNAGIHCLAVDTKTGMVYASIRG